MLDIDTEEVKKHINLRFSTSNEGSKKDNKNLHRTLVNNKEILLGKCLKNRPTQNRFGNLPTMSSIMHTVAEGWDSVNSELYFRDTGTFSRVDKIAATARNQHGDTVILLDTMNEIKVTIKQSNKGNGEISSRRFEIRCSVDNYEKTNRSLRTRHPYISFKHRNIPLFLIMISFDLCHTTG